MKLHKTESKTTHQWLNTIFVGLSLIIAIFSALPGFLQLDVRKPSAEWGLYCGPGDSTCMIYVGITNQDFKPLESIEVKLISSCGVSLPSGADEIDIEPPVQAEVETTAQMVHVRTQAVLGRGDRMDIWVPVSRGDIGQCHIWGQREFDKCFELHVFSNAGLGKLTVVHVETPFYRIYLPVGVMTVPPTPMGILPNLPLP